MKEIYKRLYFNDIVVEEDILFFSNDDDEINRYLNNYAKTHGYLQIGTMWVNKSNSNNVLVLGNGNGLF